jgi:5'-nucleotidase
MRILLTNDDAIYAPGLAAIHHELSRDHQVDVVAPDSPKSGGSHAVTIRHPVIWRTVQTVGGFEGISVEGSPADCVKLALNSLLPKPPDLVVSGINSGLNTGIHVLYSGTVAGAMEGAILGCVAVSVSLQLQPEMDYARAARIAGDVIRQIVATTPEPRQVFNINIPAFRPNWPRGVRVAPQSTRPTMDKIEKRADPNGREYYWLSGDFVEWDDDADTDIHLVRDGYVCITPLQFNMTDHRRMESLAKKTWSLSE